MEFNKPNSIQMSSNLTENFRLFKQSVQIYFNATESHSKKNVIIKSFGIPQSQKVVL